MNAHSPTLTWYCLILSVAASATHMAMAEESLHHDADAILRAAVGVKEAVPAAQRDPQRPIYHLRPAARWINDPNGCFYQDGWYHVFYQHNPYGNGWGHMHWGHARSRDNVHWEHLPIAVWPSTEKGEDHCYSGSAVKDGHGNWQLWYTSVSKVRPKDRDKGKLAWVFNGQVMLKPMDGDFIKWGKETADPVNDPTLPNNIDGYPWNKYIRDPAFFKVGDRTFMILGITGKGVPIYEAENKSLTQWKYRGEMYEPNHDCVQMIPFPGHRFVYIYNNSYITGTFDPDTAKFTPLEGMRLRPLAEGNATYVVSYSTNDQGEHTLYTWLRINDNRGRGWNGCVSLPTRLSLDGAGNLLQKAVPELRSLRGAHTRVAVSGGRKVAGEGVDVWEMMGIWEDEPTAPSLDTGAAELLFENSDFEKGTLQNWQADGDAFTVQPTKGDNPAARRRESSMHQGDYWIGTYEKYDGRTGRPGDIRLDTPTGALTSIPFKIGKRYIVFRIGGGNHPARTEVLLQVDGKSLPLASGGNSETMEVVSVDVKAHVGKTARLQVIEQRFPERDLQGKSQGITRK